MGPIFKASFNLVWMNEEGQTATAPNAQFILYPKYPEVRLSGFLKGSEKKIAPSHLMRPPTPHERAERIDTNRYLILGVRENDVLAYVSSWLDQTSVEAGEIIDSGKARKATSVFYEYPLDGVDSRSKLISKLQEIHRSGLIRSCRLNSNSEIIEYKARNGAGYTLEAQFGISPNGNSEPDFMDWELKVHSSGPVTLMTPEPNEGIYLDDLEHFLRTYGTRIEAERMDFASRHNVGEENAKTLLTLRLEGYDPKTQKIANPDGGLILRDGASIFVAGWSFSKLIDHWKKKHTNTCFVSYKREDQDVPYYLYGPEVSLATGTDLGKFLSALYTSTIYYDPGINMKHDGIKWKPKKRNQFRVAWKNIPELYANYEEIVLDSET